MSEYDDPGYSAPPSRMSGCLLQIVTHGVAVVLGAVAGVVGAQLIEWYQNPDLMSRPEGDLSRAELIAKLDAAEQAYAKLLAEQSEKDAKSKDEMTAATKKVDDLQTQVTAKEQEIKVLELKAKKSAGKSAALKKELEAKQAELDALKVQLDQALAEKAQLEQDLVVSRQETETARGETQVARGETIDARWDGFKAQAAVQICEKGNRNKLAKCKEEVAGSLSATRARQYKHCLASGQAEPRLVARDKKDDSPLPRWSEWFNQNSDFTEGAWYIVFCDPTLPESSLSSDAPGNDLDDL